MLEPVFGCGHAFAKSYEMFALVGIDSIGATKTRTQNAALTGRRGSSRRVAWRAKTSLLREECGAVEVFKSGEDAMEVGPPDSRGEPE